MVYAMSLLPNRVYQVSFLNHLYHIFVTKSCIQNLFPKSCIPRLFPKCCIPCLCYKIMHTYTKSCIPTQNRVYLHKIVYTNSLSLMVYVMSLFKKILYFKSLSRMLYATSLIPNLVTKSLS